MHSRDDVDVDDDLFILLYFFSISTSAVSRQGNDNHMCNEMGGHNKERRCGV